jgi:hypothetical protein
MTLLPVPRILLLAAFGAGTLALPALAKTRYVSFTDAVGSPGAQGPLAWFTLNDDGSFAPALTALLAGLMLLGALASIRSLPTGRAGVRHD